jgi:elongation factor P hydroxylase
MKLASMHRSLGDEIKLIRGNDHPKNYTPDKIYITSLFTYAWKPVHQAIEYYNSIFPSSQITVGGIYASLMAERIKSFYPFINVHVGLHDRAERYIPAYDMLKGVPQWENWNSSILFTSRGCIRRCPFCVVPKIEGNIRSVIKNIESHIIPGHKKIVLWDNNFLASPDWKSVLTTLQELEIKVDFNQGLDVRLINEEKASFLAKLNLDIVRMAYDNINEKKFVHKVVSILERKGFRRKEMLFYVLYNYFNTEKQSGDTPSSFFEIIRDIAKMGCFSYPMRYEPLDSLKKNSYISPSWEAQQLEALADARRVIGFNGGFPAYQGLVDKFVNAKNFNQAFELRPKLKSSVLELALNQNHMPDSQGSVALT